MAPPTDQWARIKAIFHDVVAHPPAERTALVDAACAGDHALRDEVLALLAAHERDDDSPRGPTVANGSPTPAIATGPGEKPGDHIGPYALLQKIGEGGFGQVFMAEQERPVRRRVALKVIKLGMDSQAVVARFEAERQALAVMDHPAIAKVFDGGLTPSGRPYFVMELVAGEPITAWCDRHQLPIADRLALLAQVCRAVQHAHSKGVIHRDIKPSNVMVQDLDGRPAPKIIDFGIAKATRERMTDRTLFTEFRQFVGTPEYASPEQVAGSPDIDTRTDVYALGVLLYELLTGVTPFDARRLRSAAWNEIARIIGEEHPPRPSTRVSTLGDQRAAAAGARKAPPSKLAALIRGELDWITLKAIEKDRARRYETAAAMADDLERHLRAEPVLAAPPSALYRVRLFVRRRRGIVASAAAILLALTLGLVAALYGLRQAQFERDEARQARAAEAAERQRAESQAKKARASSDFVTRMLRSADPWVAAGREMTVREMADAAYAELKAGSLADQPDELAVATLALGQTYLNLGRPDEARALLDQSLALRRTVYGAQSIEVAEALYAVASLGNDNRRHAEAVAQTAEALRICRAVTTGDHELTAQILQLHANQLKNDSSRGSEAEGLFRECLAMLARLYGQDSVELAEAQINFAGLQHALGSGADMDAAIDNAVGVMQRKLGERHPSTIRASFERARMLHFSRRYEQAQEAYERALAVGRAVLGETHPVVLDILDMLAWVRQSRDDLPAALIARRELIDLTERVYGPRSTRLAHEIKTASSCFVWLEQFDELEANLRKGVAIFEQPGGPVENSDAGGLRANLAECLFRKGLWEEAERLVVAGMAVPESLLPANALPRASFLSLLSAIRVRQGRFAEAEPLALDAFGRFDKLPYAHRVGVTLKNARRIVELYEAWRAAEPAAEGGPQVRFDEPLAKWRAKVVQLEDEAARRPPARTVF